MKRFLTKVCFQDVNVQHTNKGEWARCPETSCEQQPQTQQDEDGKCCRWIQKREWRATAPPETRFLLSHFLTCWCSPSTRHNVKMASGGPRWYLLQGLAQNWQRRVEKGSGESRRWSAQGHEENELSTLQRVVITISVSKRWHLNLLS